MKAGKWETCKKCRYEIWKEIDMKNAMCQKCKKINEIAFKDISFETIVRTRSIFFVPCSICQKMIRRENLTRKSVCFDCKKNRAKTRFLVNKLSLIL